jgi:hypothetical protein
MRTLWHIQQLFIALMCFILLSACIQQRHLITDEIVFHDGNSQTGTIQYSDTVSIKLKKMDESVQYYYWKNIDTVKGKKLRTFWGGINSGYYHVPYYSAFRNEKMIAGAFGMQLKAGMAYRGVRMYYASLTIIPAKPYAVTKAGLGFQRYLKEDAYLKKWAMLVGTEINLMNAKYNNGFQTTIEPFAGYEMQWSGTIRAHLKFGLQFNFANKNNNVGTNFTLGFHFLRHNHLKHYKELNKTKRLNRF